MAARDTFFYFFFFFFFFPFFFGASYPAVNSCLEDTAAGLIWR